MNTLCVIPARGGSKGVYKKNLCRIGDYSLVERALFTAMGTPLVDRIIVSSDCNETIQLVNKYGNFAPFIRPAKIASDTATSLSVVQHATFAGLMHGAKLPYLFTSCMVSFQSELTIILSTKGVPIAVNSALSTRL
jgi:CMP-N-acetylneuraminic acid synthetase